MPPEVFTDAVVFNFRYNFFFERYGADDNMTVISKKHNIIMAILCCRFIFVFRIAFERTSCVGY